MSQNSFGGFPDTRRSGLLSGLMTRLHDGGLNTAQLQILQSGGNPNDYKTWRVQEWMNFYADLFGLSFETKSYDHEYYRDSTGIKFHVETGKYSLSVFPKSNLLSIKKIIDAWNEKVPSPLCISLEHFKDVDFSELDAKWSPHRGYSNTCLMPEDNNKDALQCLKREPVERGCDGSTIQCILLELMLMYWKSGQMNLKKSIYMYEKYKLPYRDTYIIPCGDSIFPSPVKDDNPMFPVLTVTNERHISIYPRGSKELLDKYKPGNVVYINNY